MHPKKEFYEEVKAKDAESAIKKVRVSIGDEYEIIKSDVVILEAYKI